MRLQPKQKWHWVITEELPFCCLSLAQGTSHFLCKVKLFLSFSLLKKKKKHACREQISPGQILNGNQMSNSNCWLFLLQLDSSRTAIKKRVEKLLLHYQVPSTTKRSTSFLPLHIINIFHSVQNSIFSALQFRNKGLQIAMSDFYQMDWKYTFPWKWFYLLLNEEEKPLSCLQFSSLKSATCITSNNCTKAGGKKDSGTIQYCITLASGIICVTL